jgi:putative ABC transport system substrate-binding protein
MGFVESRDVAIEYRWAEGKQERLQGFAEDLVRRKVSVIFATGGAAPALAARAATSFIPIVFTGGSEPSNQPKDCQSVGLGHPSLTVATVG